MPSAVLDKPASTQHTHLPIRQQLTLFDLAPLTVELPSKNKKNAIRVQGKKEKKTEKKGKIGTEKGRKLNVLRTNNKVRQEESGQAFFPVKQWIYQPTEYLLYGFWSALKERNKDGFFANNVALCQYLSSEQFDVLLDECKWRFTLEDKAWLLSIMQGNRLRPMSLLLPFHHQGWAVINLLPDFPYPPVLTEVYPTFYLLLLMLALWENN